MKVMPATWEKQPDPRHLLYVDKNIRLGHWPVSVLMNGYSLFVAQLHQLKKVGGRKPGAAAACFHVSMCQPFVLVRQGADRMSS